MGARQCLVAFAGLVVLGCGVTAGWFFKGPMPARTGPRFVFTAEQLEALDSAESLSLRHNGLRSPPYWSPSTEEVEACAYALWQRVHWSFFDDEVGSYAIQYFGITRSGKRRVQMRGFCPRFYERPGEAASLSTLPAKVIGSGRCHFVAECEPTSRSVLRFAFDASHSR
jgi:hypothetical protein